MTALEWVIVVGFTGIVIFTGVWCKRYIKNTADFLVAGRGCGRYLGATAGEAASMGAISLIAFLQAAYVGGPVAWWMVVITVTVYLVIAVTGWGIYRLRQTRAMTLNELLEKRYSRKFRIFCGGLCFVSGVMNMGIFPIVTGRFVVYFCQLPQMIQLGALSFPTVWLTTGVLVSISLLLAFKGGQVSLIITDFLQWSLMMGMYIGVGIAVYRVVNWDHISQALLSQEESRPLVDPFMATTATDFGLWYCVLFGFRAFYNVLSWAPSSVRAQSATQAREAKLMWILSNIRQGANMGLIFAAVACFAFMKLPQFSELASQVQGTLDTVANEKIRSEMAVPIFLSYVLPAGLKGLFLAGMISASISTLDTYFLTWAGVLTQDLVAPIGKERMTQEQRLKLLRWSIIGISLFVYIFSLLWKQTDYIWMYFAITGSIYTGGAGAVLLGALYWPKATTSAAWSAMLTGSGLAITSIFVQQQCNDMSWWPSWLNGMWLSVFASLSAISVFIIVSLLTCRERYNLDLLLNRNEFRCEDEPEDEKGFTTFEIIVGIVTLILIVSIVIGVWYSRTHNISEQSWVKFWKYYSFTVFAYSIPVAIWFFIGSLFDLKKLFAKLHELHTCQATDTEREKQLDDPERT